MNTLTQQQIDFFDTFGFLSFPGLLADRIGEITEAFENVWVHHGGGHHGKKHDGQARSCIVPFIDQSAVLSSLLDDPRIDAIPTSLLGHDYNYMGSDGNYYVGDTGWHSDGWHQDIRFIKIAFYLDPLTRDTGALRVIPGSHRIHDSYAKDVQAKIGRSKDLWDKLGSEVPAIALETKPGDIVCFNHNTKHAAFGGSKNRRMFTMNLCQRFPEHRLEELQKYIGSHARFWIERNVGPEMLRTAGPNRMKHLQQVMENDGLLKELSRQMKEKMLEPSRG